MLMVWLVGSVIASAAYLGYAIYFWGILNDPSTLGDLVSGMAAFISLPSIFFVLLQEKKREKKYQEDKVLQQKREDVAQHFSVVNEIYSLQEKFQKYGLTIIHLLEDMDEGRLRSKNAPTWHEWHNPDGVFEYLRAAYFSAGRKKNFVKNLSENLKNYKFRGGFIVATEGLVKGYAVYNELITSFGENFNSLSPDLPEQVRDIVKVSHLNCVVETAQEAVFLNKKAKVKKEVVKKDGDSS